MVSACLAGENCKYNGGSNRNRKVLQLMEENEVITVCPEQMGGLPTPRVPSEIRNGVVTAKDGRGNSVPVLQSAWRLPCGNSLN